jgi:hypothetical protein
MPPRKGSAKAKQTPADPQMGLGGSGECSPEKIEKIKFKSYLN